MEIGNNFKEVHKLKQECKKKIPELRKLPKMKPLKKIR